MARKSKYETHVESKLMLVECWARDGVIDKDIAKKLGVAYSTFREYVKKYPALSAALKKGKEVIDYEVENALLKRALGYDYSEERIEIERLPGGAVRSQKIIQITKHVPPDVGAAAFWLKNRRPDRWRDRPIEDAESFGQLEALIEGIRQNE